MSNYNDLDKRKETQRKWREKNREKLRAYYKEKYGAEYKKKWRQSKLGQRAIERANRKAYYEINKEDEQKKSRDYMREYYKNHKEEMNQKNKIKYQKRKQWFVSYLSTKKCAHCDISDIECFELHHKIPKGRLNGKRIDPVITTMLNHSEKKILKEIEKCIVLCANCHRKIHTKLRKET